MIDNKVATNAKYPVLEISRFGPIAFEVLIYPDENLLSQILGFSRPARVPVTKVINPSRVHINYCFPG